ncbi:MAG: hypothetical protein LBS89_03170, partial [Zoogloeaceae bacterium]|nr:hypothetical protein [Zoogloeaceae bacterium]
MNPKIALRIHVSSQSGARLLPPLLERLAQYQANATFLLSLGPDDAPFFSRLLVSGEVGKKAEAALRAIEDQGFEAGLSAWDAAGWKKRAARADSADNPWIAADLDKGMAAFLRLFNHPPQIFGAPDWQAHRHELRLLQRFGFQAASDCRGSHPFVPIWQGEPLPCPQLPTTLPTFSELRQKGESGEMVVESLLTQTQTPLVVWHVFSFAAEEAG